MKRLILTSLALVALASCQKESTVDSAITSGKEITYTTYAGASTTKGTAINSNTGLETEGAAFKVSAYSGEEAYFGFNTVTYTDNSWVNGTSMYWPNADTDLHFGAYYPADATFDTNPSFSYATDANSLTFGYTVESDVEDQIDLMYAITDLDFEARTTDESSVGLHFKHALTQIGFTATKDADINVTVTSVKICNVVDNGTFTATANTNDDGTINDDQNSEEATSAGVVWSLATATDFATANTVDATNLQNYAAAMVYFETDATGIKVTAAASAETATQLTSTTDVMMLLPQSLEAWDAETSDNNDGTESYLAIQCTITHSDGEAPILENATIYVPFSTEGLAYNLTDNEGDDSWLPGYKITYNLHFGGGYILPTSETEPDPGQTPDDVEGPVETLRPITYTVTVDDWISVDGGTINGSTTEE